MLPLQEWKHALFILPYVSVVAEKAAHFADVMASSGCRAKGFHGKAERGTPLQPGWVPALEFAFASAVRGEASLPISSSFDQGLTHGAGARRWQSAPLRRRTWPSTVWCRRIGWVRMLSYSSAFSPACSSLWPQYDV